MLKAAKQQSGSTWNEKRNMVEGPPALWENLMVTFPKIKKFNNNKATFPLFDALGELYDGHLAEGTWNCTSLEAPQEEELNEQLQDAEDRPQGFDLNVVHDVDDEVDDALAERNEDMLQGRANT
uniref:Myb/SANT-like domain-containing protein n=2 Tax=Zea mays TaxID=4577 RepID=A0A804U7U9_MAIZE